MKKTKMVAVLSDGSVIAYDENRENFNDFDLETKIPVAVIFRKGNKGSALGVGLQQSTSLAWAKAGTPGYNTNFTTIQCTPKQDGTYSWGVWDSSKTWEGDTDGSDNWEQIKAYFSQSESKTEGQNLTNYPAFNYALTYGTTATLTGTYADNWFLPSIAELVELYTSKEKVNKVLKALGLKAQVIKDGWYWSSSQNYDNYVYALELDLSDGTVSGGGTKDSDIKYVCVVRAFR